MCPIGGDSNLEQALTEVECMESPITQQAQHRRQEKTQNRALY